jgi:hypothetical protein
MKTPETAQEITAAAFDGDPMTGYEQQTAFNGDVASQPRHRFAMDGKIDTEDQRLREEEQKNKPALPSPWATPSLRPAGY